MTITACVRLPPLFRTAPQTEIRFDLVSAVDELAAQVRARAARLGSRNRVQTETAGWVEGACAALTCSLPGRPFLQAQIKLEFDFRREARIMDAVARQFTASLLMLLFCSSNCACPPLPALFCSSIVPAHSCLPGSAERLPPTAGLLAALPLTAPPLRTPPRLCSPGPRPALAEAQPPHRGAAQRPQHGHRPPARYELP